VVIAKVCQECELPFDCRQANEDVLNDIYKEGLIEKDKEI
jgi:antitoxin component of RelBE/YafQ-DinJ toxin-antitoxin module